MTRRKVLGGAGQVAVEFLISEVTGHAREDESAGHFLLCGIDLLASLAISEWMQMVPSVFYAAGYRWYPDFAGSDAPATFNYTPSESRPDLAPDRFKET